MAEKDLAVVFMVAGMSSRFGGRAKAFVKIGKNDESLIEYSADQALKAGFNRIIFIVSDKTEAVFREVFGSEYKGASVEYAFQNFDPDTRDRPWGTVDAVCAIKKIDCPFVVCNGDDIYGENSFRALAKHLSNEETCATIGYKLDGVLPEEGSVNRGKFKVDEEGNVVNIEEIFNIERNDLDKTGSKLDDLCSMNLFGLQKEVLNMLREVLERFKMGNEGDRRVECLLPKELGNLISEGKIVMKLYPTDDSWFGVTNPGDELIVKEAIAKL